MTEGVGNFPAEILSIATNNKLRDISEYPKLCRKTLLAFGQHPQSVMASCNSVALCFLFVSYTSSSSFVSKALLEQWHDNLFC